MLCLSLYPDKCTLEDDIAYLDLAWERATGFLSRYCPA